MGGGAEGSRSSARLNSGPSDVVRSEYVPSFLLSVLRVSLICARSFLPLFLRFVSSKCVPLFLYGTGFFPSPLFFSWYTPSFIRAFLLPSSF
jgi:hypothetical protein